MTILDRKDPANFIIELKYNAKKKKDMYYAYYFDPDTRTKEVVASSTHKTLVRWEIESFGCPYAMGVKVVDLRDM